MIKRPRRLRVSGPIRAMVQETRLCARELIAPLFAVEGTGVKREIPSLPGQYHFSVDMLAAEVKEIASLGVGGVLLFGIPDQKDAVGTGAWAEDGIVQRAVRSIKREFPDMVVITDLCMCEYTDHGHCGILKENGYVDNDETLDYLCKIAVSQAKAGADIIAPSDMMDGRVGAIRRALDENGFVNVSIMSYSAKYASSYYGPFREAAGSAPSFGDRKSYQMDFANSDEALRECALDVEEGADFLMVKPALSYLDVVSRVKRQFNLPLAVYNVSGEYAMLVNAVKNGMMREDVIYETILSMKRAGADIIITYFAKYLAGKLQDRNS